MIESSPVDCMPTSAVAMVRKTLEEAYEDVVLSWAVKDSFIRYLHSMPDSSFRVLNGAATLDDGDGWEFSYAGHELTRDHLLLKFSGELRISAHGGALLVIIMNPQLDIGPEGATLSMVDLMYWPDTTRREVIGYGTLRSVPDAGAARLVAELRLAESALETFNRVYPAGALLAPAVLSKK